jgi:hypothetical protein
MRTTLIFVLTGALCTLPLTACKTAPAGWEKSSSSMSDLERDKAQCSYEAKAATASYRSQPSKPGEAAAMGAAIGDGVVIAEKQIELTNDCMKARGYKPHK